MTDLVEYEKLRAEAKVCALCPLCTTRTEVVVDRGNPDARLMFIGEAPGEKEDIAGEAFVGPAGEELDRLINAAGLKPDQYVIANVLKCRPPENKFPGDSDARFTVEETVLKCLPYLDRQIELVNPRAIILIGRKAVEWTIYRNRRPAPTMGSLSGKWIRSDRYRNIEFFGMFHTAYLLRLKRQEPLKAARIEEETSQALRWAADVLSGNLPDGKPVLLREAEKRPEQGRLF